MQTYGKFRPTGFDPAGAFLDDRQDWLVVPCGRTRDSGPLEESNFAAALELLGGEGDDVEVHRFGHWGPGWFEIIIVRPGSEAASKAENIETSLEDYPLLNESDFCNREWEDYKQGWDSYGARDFVSSLGQDFNLQPSTMDFLWDIDKEALREFFQENVKSGEYYIGESSGVSVNLRAFDCSREELAQFIRAQRKALAST